MGADYLLVHVKYTIPPALLLGALYRPLQTRLDTYKIIFLITAAMIATTPWDSYLVISNVWTYPPDAVLGPTIFRIPIEEVFFFFIQTYMATLLYLLCNKATVHVAYLNEIDAAGSRARVRRLRVIGASVAAGMAWAIFTAIGMVHRGGEGVYMGLLIAWAGSFILILWCISYRHMLSLPLQSTLPPILVPTVYLWIVDTMELRRGTWAISAGTKLDVHPWPGMEIEEMAFFFLSNVLIVFGLVAFDYAVALMTAFPSLYPHIISRPPITTLFRDGMHALFTLSFPKDEYHSIAVSIDILKRKSRSFYLASGVFEGRLRMDLILLYSFCRAADDLIDDSPSPEQSLERLKTLLGLFYDPARRGEVDAFVTDMFPSWSHAPLLALPAHKLPRQPLDELLEGFRMDMEFAAGRWPIATEADLRTYAHRVAGTVGEMFCQLVFAHAAADSPRDDALLESAREMGIALQYVNIARDIRKDADMRRVYIPGEWLKEKGMNAEMVVRAPQLAERFRGRLLAAAEMLYNGSRKAIDELPVEARLGARVAVESYMDIGRRLGEKRWKGGRVVRAWWVLRG